MQSTSVNVAVWHLVVMRRIAIVLVFLSLLTNFYLAARYYISTMKPRPSQDILSNTIASLPPAITDRVARFNVQLHSLRLQLRLSSSGNDTSETTCRTSAVDNRTATDRLGTAPLRVVWSTRENYTDELVSNPDITTVFLPWLLSRSNWSSLTDFSNVLYQRYYEWTADNVLCSSIETPGVIAARYDSVYRRTCNRNISDTARGQSLRPLYLNGRPINRNYYWPNNGDSYPEHFYTTTPRYIFYMHIHRDAVVTQLGDVITARTKLVLYACSRDLTPTLPLGGKLSHIP